MAARGAYVRRLEGEIPAQRERLAAELRILADTELDDAQRATVTAALRADHRQSLRDLRAALRRLR